MVGAGVGTGLGDAVDGTGVGPALGAAVVGTGVGCGVGSDVINAHFFAFRGSRQFTPTQ